VIWDPAKRAVVLIADPMGKHSLYYHLTDNYIFWASRPRVLLQFVDAAVRPNPEYMADFLINRASSVTPYEQIERVPGGHALSVSTHDQSIRSYWRLAPAELHYRKDEEYESRFIELFTESVRCRIQTSGPVFCELSGGVDSSSIACMAKAVAGVDASRRIKTVAYTFPVSAASDESRYIQTMVGALDLPHMQFSELDCPLLETVTDPQDIDFPSNDLAFQARHDRLAAAMRSAGSRVVLSGIGGDQLFWSTPPVLLPLLDEIAARRPLGMLQRTGECSRIGGANYFYTLVLGLRTSLKFERHGLPDRMDGPIGGWFHSDFVRKADLASRLSAPMGERRGKLPSDAYKHSLIERTMRDFALTRAMGRSYVVTRYPYLDQRLVEFAMGLPFDQCVRWPETRSIVRRALKGRLPDEIINRATKAGPTEAYLRALIYRWPQILKESPRLRVVEYGIVDDQRFRFAIESARMGMVTHAAQLLSTVCLELWLRSLDGSALQGPARPQQACRPFRETRA
jgi:asparagine synthase (glutamine-hydrolysing)